MRSKVFLLLLLVVIHLPSVSCQSNMDILNLTVDLDDEGFVKVEYILSFIEEKASINIIGSSLDEVKVLNQDGLSMNFSISDDRILIESDGSKIGYLLYETNSFITKFNDTFWVFEVVAPIPIIVNIPEEFVIVDSQPDYLSIGIVDGRPTMVMPKGHITIKLSSRKSNTYLEAFLLLNEARSQVSYLEDNGISINEAKIFLNLAEEAFFQNRYDDVIDYARSVFQYVNQTIVFVDSLYRDLEILNEMFKEYSVHGSQDKINEINMLIIDINDLIDVGDYYSAYKKIIDARVILLNNIDKRNTLDYIYITLILFFCSLFLFLYFRRKSNNDIEDEIDYDNLRADDQEVINYIRENDGAFITDVRDRFNLPKSSAWRMMRRLEDIGVIETSIVGRETFVKIRENS